MTIQVLFVNVFFKKKPHLNAVLVHSEEEYSLIKKAKPLTIPAENGKYLKNNQKGKK